MTNYDDELSHERKRFTFTHAHSCLLSLINVTFSRLICVNHDQHRISTPSCKPSSHTNGISLPAMSLGQHFVQAQATNHLLVLGAPRRV